MWRRLPPRSGRCSVTNEARPVFALHGWALNAAVFDPFAGSLAGRGLQVVDLPGHGSRRDEPLGRDADAVAEALLAHAPSRAVWLGWSLGGMLALAAAARRPERIGGLILVAAAPSFVARPGWPAGMPAGRLRRMAADLLEDPVRTVNDFLTLQVLSSASGRTALRGLRGALRDRGMAAPAALADGLTLLEQMDLRAALDTLEMPVLVAAGGRDRLVHPDAARALTEALPNGELALFDDAGHAPFLSHPAAFAARAGTFLDAVEAAHAGA